MTTLKDVREAGAMSRVRSKIRSAIAEGYSGISAQHLTMPERAVLHKLKQLGQIRYIVSSGCWTLTKKISYDN